MPKRSKQARAREFNEASRKIIKERDLYQCIFLPYGISYGGCHLVRTAAAEHHALHTALPGWSRDPAEWCIGLPESP